VEEGNQYCLSRRPVLDGVTQGVNETCGQAVSTSSTYQNKGKCPYQHLISELQLTEHVKVLKMFSSTRLIMDRRNR
jgi:hypothetical protein